MYLVVECTTRSAPSVRGCCHPGERKVLSTTTRAPAACPSCAQAAMSVMRSSGLLGVSIHSSAAGVDSAARSAAASPKSTNSTCRSPRGRQAARGDDRAGAVLELRQRLPEQVAGRVARASVVVGALLTEAAEGERGG